MAVGKAISSGKYVGSESKREGKTIDGVNYISKCPFGTYYCINVQSRGKRTTAGEKKLTINKWISEATAIGSNYPQLRNMTTTVLEQLFFAKVELDWYNNYDIICAQKSPMNKGQTKDRLMKNRFSSLKQRADELKYK